MPQLFKVYKEWDEKYPRVRSIVVKEVPTGYRCIGGDRGPFHFRTRFGFDDYPLTADEAVRDFEKQQHEAIAQSKTDIAEAEFNLLAIKRGRVK